MNRCCSHPSAPSRSDEPIDEEEQKCADNGSNKTRPLIFPIPSDRMPEPAGKEGAGDAEQDGNDAATRIAAGHQQLGDAAGEQADDDPAKNSVIFQSKIPSSQAEFI